MTRTLWMLIALAACGHASDSPDLPPERINASPDPEDVLVLDAIETSAFVMVADEAPEALTCSAWLSDTAGQHLGRVPTLTISDDLDGGCIATVTRDRALEGRTLTVRITDAAGGWTAIAWTIVVP